MSDNTSLGHDTELFPIPRSYRSSDRLIHTVSEEDSERGSYRQRRNYESQSNKGPLGHQSRGLLAGWKFTAFLAFISSVVGLLFNAGFLVYSAAGSRNGEEMTLVKGYCKKVQYLSTALHWLINVLVTILLSASDFGMQCLLAPTRKHIDRAHKKGQLARYWSAKCSESIRSIFETVISMAMFMYFVTSFPFMGQQELSDIAQDKLTSYLQQALTSENPEAGTMLLFGLQAGRGPASFPENMCGSVLPAWRSAYAHVFTLGASINATGDASESLGAAADYYKTVKEPIWRKWAPNTGSYMNEGNPFSSAWKKDFHGENYDKLLAIKRKYDPTESLFVWSGVGSDLWNNDLRTGLLCRVAA